MLESYALNFGACRIYKEKYFSDWEFLYLGGKHSTTNKLQLASYFYVFGFTAFFKDLQDVPPSA